MECRRIADETKPPAGFCFNLTMAAKIILWLPRILSILFVIFLSLFAMDVFAFYKGWALIQALFIHLLPAIILAAVIVISWRYELAGAISFLLFACAYVWVVGMNRPWSWYAFIMAPAFFIGIFFFLSWLYKKRTVDTSIWR